jgi:hypothetical protein
VVQHVDIGEFEADRCADSNTDLNGTAVRSC